MASAQAPDQMAGKPDQAYWLAADSAVDGGDDFLVPPDSEVGQHFDGPEECPGWTADCGDAGDGAEGSVVAADLGIDGVAEAHEENPGGFAAVGGSRLRITLSVQPGIAGPVTLDVTTGDDKVALFAYQTGGSPIGNHLWYSTAAQVPAEVWLQGIAASDVPQGVTLALRVAGCGFSPPVGN